MKLAQISYTFFLFAFSILAAFFAGNILYKHRVEIFNFLRPCTAPVTYRLGAIDARFGLSREIVLKALEDAEQIWENSWGRNLLAHDADGAVAVHFIYDYRQEATERLKPLGATLEDNETAYTALKKQYDSLRVDYETKKIALDSLVARYSEKKNDYDARVEFWNDRRGAPRKEFEEFNQERENLDALIQDIRAREAGINDIVGTINAIGEALNRLAQELNLHVEHYNAIGEARGREFEEGTYFGRPGSGEINIYEFDSRERLVRVLAHEFGHALGLPHVEDPRAIMYRLNQGMNEKLSATDAQALEKKCRAQ